MMRRALIGHTGFVGTNLDRQQAFTDRYNSRNFTDMRGESFDEIVCAGVQAVKWWANQNPEQDWAGIKPLLDVLGTVTTKRFVLISSVDVYADPRRVDETSKISADDLHPYGLHRWKVEQWVRKSVPDHTIARLPGLFGPGLKKNLIFDVLTGKPIDGFDGRSEFQFYNLDRLGDDLDIARDAGLKTVNLAVEPVDVASVVSGLTGKPYENHLEKPPHFYDVQTIHANAWERDGPYLVTAGQCLREIQKFADDFQRDPMT